MRLCVYAPSWKISPSSLGWTWKPVKRLTLGDLDRLDRALAIAWHFDAAGRSRSVGNVATLCFAGSLTPYRCRETAV